MWADKASNSRTNIAQSLLPQKKGINHMHNYLVSCSYDKIKRFKKSPARTNTSAQPTKVDGPVQIIVDNFDPSLSSPDVVVSSHDFATIETYSTPATEESPCTISRISKTEMSGFIRNEEDVFSLYNGSTKSRWV